MTLMSFDEFNNDLTVAYAITIHGSLHTTATSTFFPVLYFMASAW